MRRSLDELTRFAEFHQIAGAAAPMTLSLLGLGLVALGFRRRKQMTSSFRSSSNE
jgi:hypothetical protein